MRKQPTATRRSVEVVAKKTGKSKKAKLTLSLREFERGPLGCTWSRIPGTNTVPGEVTHFPLSLKNDTDAERAAASAFIDDLEEELRTVEDERDAAYAFIATLLGGAAK